MAKRQIYALQHDATKKIYIGTSQNPVDRYRTHMSLLRNGKHKNEDMQSDYDNVGKEFSLFILEEIDTASRVKEYEWMRKYKSHVRGRGYNYKDKFAQEGYTSTLDVPLKDGLPEMPTQEV